jgi:hypothetical protein
MNFLESDKLLFILANPGSGGHRLGRIISCIDTVLWYGCSENGQNPWNAFYSDSVAGKNISEFHYDRLLENLTIPLVGERILKWWNKDDHLKYYQTNWQTEMEKISLVDNKFLHWVLHDDPKSLHETFPNAKIISLIDLDIDVIADRYMKTSALFPAFVRLPNLKPKYENRYAIDMKSLMTVNERPTEKDLWFYQNPESTEVDYYTNIKNMLDAKNRMRLSYDNPKHFKLTWKDLKLDLLLDFLSSKNINENYKTLIKV